MKKIIANIVLAGILVLVGLSVNVGLINNAAAIDPAAEARDGLRAAGGGDTANNALQVSVRDVVNVLLYVIGAIAVIMIVVGGIKYTLSNGDSSQVTSAKNTILYAIVGLVVAIFAYAIVNFVIQQFDS